MGEIAAHLHGTLLFTCVTWRYHSWALWIVWFQLFCTQFCMALLSPDTFLRAAFGQVLLESDKQGVEANPIGTPSQSISKIDLYMSRGRYFVHQAIGGVPTSFSSSVWFLKAWPRTLLPYRVWMPYFFLTGWLVAGCSWLWLAGLGWLGWLAWLAAGWVADWLVPGWLAGCIYYMIMDGWYLMDAGSRP